MLDTKNIYCRQIIDILRSHGVRTAYCSPGSRNTPLLIAMDACEEISKRVVVDERSAAFQAYGCAVIDRSPVALLCTSGTAVLNYSPAVAEAYYSGIPLIVISADRPREWIDQDDSQTIRQYGVLSHIVKGSYDIRAIPEGKGAEFTEEVLWTVNRTMNEAMIQATEGKPGPVHINVQLAEPLGEVSDAEPINQRKVSLIDNSEQLPREAIMELANELIGCKVMLVAGFNAPDHRLDRAIRQFATYSNVVVMAETLANLHEPQPLSSMVDAVLCDMTDEEKSRMRPDIVISIGGALVSRILKQYLRDYPPRMHWSLGLSNYFCDCFRILSHKIEVSPVSFFRQLCGVIRKSKRTISSGYSSEWLSLRNRSRELARDYISYAPWSDIKALDYIFSHYGFDNLFVSNGTLVRYSQLLPHSCHAEYCNRGVSGIDGSTSTAVGAAWSYRGLTTLLSGDTSWLYDSGASTLSVVPFDMRMIVIDNSGGGIFRFVKSTSDLPEEMLERYFSVHDLAEVGDIASAYGIDVMEASDMFQLEEGVAWLSEKGDFPKLLLVKTPPKVSGEILSGYFSKAKSVIASVDGK